MKLPVEMEDSQITPSAAPVSLSGLLAVLVFGAVCLGFHWLGRDGWVPLLDSANLALHEAGHPLVGMFSARATVYGGTLFQLVFPLAAAWHFRRADNAVGMAAALLWLGENLFNIARYMADARVQELPLVGSGDHDWTEIFGRWGILHLDGRIASLTRGCGFLLMVGVVLWLYRRWRADSRSRFAGATKKSRLATETADTPPATTDRHDRSPSRDMPRITDDGNGFRAGPGHRSGRRD